MQNKKPQKQTVTESIEKSRPTLQCICGKFFNLSNNLPKLLPCGDTLCYSCSQESLEKKKVICKKCQKEILKDPSSFPVDIQMLNLVKQQESIIKEKEEQKFEDVNCKQHDQPLILFCHQCKQLMCVICHQYGKHQNHNAQDIYQAINSFQTNQISQFQNKILTENQVVEKNIQEIAQRLVLLESEYTKATNYVQDTFDKLAEQLREIKLTKLQKLKDLQNQIKNDLQLKQKLYLDQQSEFQKCVSRMQQSDALYILKTVELASKQKIKSDDFQSFSISIQNVQQTIINTIENVFNILYANIQQQIQQDLKQDKSQYLISALDFQSKEEQEADIPASRYNMFVFKEDCSLQQYDIIAKQFNQKEVLITDNPDFNCTQILQISQDKFIISGGMKSKRFTVFQNEHINEYSMQVNRSFHKMAFHPLSSSVYVISGYHYNAKNQQ